MINFIKSGNTITLHISGEIRPRVLQVNTRTSEILSKIKEINTAYKINLTNKLDLLNDFLAFIAPIKYVATKHERLMIGDDNMLYLKGYEERPIFGYLGRKMVEFIEEDYDVEYLINFWENCMLNPKKEAVNELFDFLEANKYPITPDGCFIGYKKVKSVSGKLSDNKAEKFKGLRMDSKGNVRDAKGHFVGNPLCAEYKEFVKSGDFLEQDTAMFVDSYSGTIKQSIGSVVKMPREECDSDRNQTCSTGLHVGAWDYSKNFSGNTMIYIKVNPMNVVAVPTDYNNGKLRCCEYQIVGIAEDSELSVKVFE